MSERERVEQRADAAAKDEGDSGTEQETPDVEAHRLEGAARTELPRVEGEGEAEDRQRWESGA